MLYREISKIFRGISKIFREMSIELASRRPEGQVFSSAVCKYIYIKMYLEVGGNLYDAVSLAVKAALASTKVNF